MQAPCPQCGTKIVIDDAKLPDRPFQVRCPKCQAVSKFPGKAAAPAPSEEPPAAAPPVDDEVRAQLMAQVRREMATSVPGGHRALVSVADRSLAGSATVMLSRLGYEIDAIDDVAEAGRLMEQGIHEVVVATRAAGGQGKAETLYQRLNRLSPDARRRLFVVLVGDEFKTGDGTQAWVCLADLVVHSRDAANADTLLRNTMVERSRLYQAFNDAHRRHEEAAG